jgi:hypothetical protein
MFDDTNDTVYQEFTLTNDYIAFRPSKKEFQKVLILDLLEGKYTKSVKYEQLRRIHNITNHHPEKMKTNTQIWFVAPELSEASKVIFTAVIATPLD